MHGIRLDNIGRKEAMKMFNAIDLLVCLIENKLGFTDLLSFLFNKEK